MTDEQGIVAALIAVGTAIAGAIKWAAGRLAKSQDDAAARYERVVERNSDVMLENTTSNAVLSADIRQVVQILRPPPAAQPVAEASPEALGIEITTVTTTTKRTPAAGTPVGHYRATTHGGER